MRATTVAIGHHPWGAGCPRLWLIAVAAVGLLGLALCPSRAQAQAGAASGEGVESEVDLDDAADSLPRYGADFHYEIYQVGGGDTVENIAVRFGVPAERIRQFNGLTSAELRVGQALAIPLPGRGARRPAELPPPPPPLNIIEPCYALVGASASIVSEPTPIGARDVLWEAETGTQVIVNAEQGDYWGVVMIDGSVGWIAKSSVQMSERRISAEQLETMLRGGRPDIIQEAFRYLGTPYRYGGRLPYNVDCSLLVQTVFASKGVRLPRTAAEQYEVGQPVSFSELLPGDRLYFVNRSGRIDHTGIYAGNGRFIHASSRRGAVGVDALYSGMFWARFIGARRS